MDPQENSLRPGAGNQARKTAGCERIIEDASVALSRIRRGRHDRGFILFGPRRGEQAVLLSRIAQIARSEGYQPIMFEVPEGKRLAELLVPPLRDALLQLNQATSRTKSNVREAFSTLSSFSHTFDIQIEALAFEVGPTLGIADSGNLELDLSGLFIAVARAARESNSGLALFIDELQSLSRSDLAAFIAALHKIQQVGLPLICFAAGTPQLPRLVGEAKPYAERLFEFRPIVVPSS